MNQSPFPTSNVIVRFDGYEDDRALFSNAETGEPIVIPPQDIVTVSVPGHKGGSLLLRLKRNNSDRPIYLISDRKKAKSRTLIVGDTFSMEEEDLFFTDDEPYGIAYTFGVVLGWLSAWVVQPVVSMVRRFVPTRR